MTDLTNKQINALLEMRENAKNVKKCCNGIGTFGKCGRGEKDNCDGMHCRCLNLGGTCPNMHYAECREHYIHVEFVESNLEVSIDGSILQNLCRMALERNKYKEEAEAGRVLAKSIEVCSILDLTPPPNGYSSEKKEGWVAAMRLFCKEDVASRREALSAYHSATRDITSKE